MIYREPAHVEREVVLSAKKAIMDLYREFYGVWDVEPETLLGYLGEAFTSEGERSPNHIVRVLRMLVRNGHRPEDLIETVCLIQREGGFVPQPTKQRISNPYADEVVPTGWGYPRGYEPMDFWGQVRELSRFFPGVIGTGDRVERPVSCEGFHPIVVPKLEALGRAWNVRDPYGYGYETIVRRVADEVQRVFRSRRSGFAKSPLDLKDFSRLEPYGSAREALMTLELRQPGSGSVAFPAQLGIRWAGSSMRRVRWHCEETDFEPMAGFREFVLPSYVILIALLLQPERLLNVASLYMFCAGENAVKKGFLGHNGVGFAFGSGVLHFMDCPQSSPDKMYGVPTGLVPR